MEASVNRKEFKRRIEALYGQEFGSQTWFSRASRVDGRTVRRWIQEDGAPIPGWCVTIVEAFERIKQLDGEAPGADHKSAKGRPPTTGRYKTRAELCDAVLRDHYLSDMTISDIARAARISPTAASTIISRDEGVTTALRGEIKRRKR
jgi:hypothetical protein